MHHLLHHRWSFLLLCGLSVACDTTTSPDNSLFRAIPPRESSVHFANTLTETEAFNLIEYLYFYNGGGVAIGDINQDGLPDIYFSANQTENKLYLNKGNWSFEDITDKAGVAASGAWKTGVTMADVNGDGLLDIYQRRLGDYKGIKGKNQLFINNGNLTFSEQAEEYGLAFQGFSTQAAFFDYDRDGDLDMYLLNHSVHTERSYGQAALRKYEDPKAGDRLYRNDQGRFLPVTKEAGIYSSHIGYGLGIGVSDVNNDGWPDIYISNDFNENDYLYLNNGADGQDGPAFREVIQQSIGHTSRFSMGNDLADYNNDGLIDILSLDMLPADEVVIKRSAGDDANEIYRLKLSFGYGRQFTRNTLQLNTGILPDGTPTFSEIGQIAGVHATDWSWSPLFADYDNDGWKDLFISNGIRRRPNDMDYINFISSDEVRKGLQQNPPLSDQRLADEMPDGAVPNFFFKNKGDLTFQDVSKEWGITNATLSNGAAFADLDLDGDLDMVVNHINQTASILRNYARELHPENAYIELAFKGHQPNTQGIGARIQAYTGDTLHYIQNFNTRGFQSSVPPSLHIGLGNHQHLDSLRITWPDGKTQLIRHVPVNQRLVLNQSEASHSIPIPPIATPPLLALLPGLLPAEVTHRENEFNDFNSAFLIPHTLSAEGPPLAVADVNKDGLEDVYLGGAAGQSGYLLIQKNGQFEQSKQPAFQRAIPREETDALFFDANGDGAPDLYLVTGGNDESMPDSLLHDLLFLNDGKGHFLDRTSYLPANAQQGAVATAADFDRDGDIDLFVGGRCVAARYGVAPSSYLLLNDGKGHFQEATPPALRQIGMVTSAAWADLNGDTWPELIVAGEWMPPIIFENKKGALHRLPQPTLNQWSGWWQSIQIADLDSDGDPDLILGNQGENTRHRPSQDYPLHLYAADYDKNGSLDPLLAYSTPSGVYPIATRDELIKQIPSFKKQFIRHADYAGKTISQILSSQAIEQSIHLQANTFRSLILENIGDLGFQVRPLPIEAQFSPVKAIFVADLNRDQQPDIVLAGNAFGHAPYYGTYDAGKGLVLLGKGNLTYTPQTIQQSGLYLTGEVRHIAPLAFKGNPSLILGIHNEKPRIYQVSSSTKSYK